jgi:hypothetical protein
MTVLNVIGTLATVAMWTVTTSPPI